MTSALSLLSLPNELLLIVAGGFDNVNDVYSLFLTNSRLSYLLTSLLHEYAVKDREDLTALQWATSKGYLDLAKLVLSKGADPNHLPVPKTPTLLPNTLTPQPLPKSSVPALHYAIKSGSLPLVKLLLDHGADPNMRGESSSTALHLAVCSLSTDTPHDPEVLEMIRLLMGKGADPSMTDADWCMPLHYAAPRCAGDITAMEIILECTAVKTDRAMLFRIAHGSSDPYVQPLIAFIRAENRKGVTLLLRCGADANTAGYGGIRPLHVAFFVGINEIIRALLIAGANIHTRDNNDFDVWHFDRMGVYARRYSTTWEEAYKVIGMSHVGHKYCGVRRVSKLEPENYCGSCH